MTRSESGVEVVVEPFAFDGRGGSAALCLHGLTGTPYEVRPLGRAVADAGIHAFGPALPGHNATPEALAAVAHGAWLDAAHGHLGALRERFDRVAVVGLSMGGLLALALAQSARVDALVVVGTPLELPRPVRWTVPWLKRLWPMSTKRGGSDIRDAAARARHPSYDVMPLHSVHELMRLQRRVRGGLSAIRAPILVAHGAHDRTADPADARRIFDAVSSEVREHYVCAASAHVVPVDHDGAELGRRTAEFIGRFV